MTDTAERQDLGPTQSGAWFREELEISEARPAALSVEYAFLYGKRGKRYRYRIRNGHRTTLPEVIEPESSYGGFQRDLHADRHERLSIREWWSSKKRRAPLSASES